MLAAAEQAGRNLDRLRVAQRLDRRTGGDLAVERQLDRTLGCRHHAAGEALAEIAGDDIGRELLVARRVARADADRGRLGHAQHFERARAMGQAAQEAALFEAGDQPVDTRLGFEVERVFHLVERGRDAALGEIVVDVDQQLVLFAGEHRGFLSLLG